MCQPKEGFRRMKKIPNVFERDWEGDSSRVLPVVLPESAWALAGHPALPTQKWDGTACLIKGGVLFKRYDAKHGKTPPLGFSPAQEPDPKTGHWPGWLLVDASKPEDRWHAEALSRSSADGALDDGTYELCGPKIQGNPQGLDRHLLIRHGIHALPFNDIHDYDSVFMYLREYQFPIEGIVFHHPDGRMAKVKRRDFGLEWPIIHKESVA
jgi:hypothetical protein